MCDSAGETLSAALGLKPPHTPFRWQLYLLEKLVAGEHVQAIDIPTGLGKTAVMAVWLVAKIAGAPLPRRLVYIVDRRAVVDQATTEAERLRNWLESAPEAKRKLGLDPAELLPISTLRGQFADNRHWLSDPASHAIVVGTVDMVGSRLLFGGYNVSRKVRPYHAGFLGSDTLFVLDEAHLVPPFEALLIRVTTNETELRGKQDAAVLPPSLLLSLSATGRGSGTTTLQISEDDFTHSEAEKRLSAIKRLRLLPPENEDDTIVDRLANEAWSLTENGAANKHIIVFCNSREVAMKTEQAVSKLAKGDKKRHIPARSIATQLFIGARRVRERQDVAAWLAQHGFLGGRESSSNTPAFVFATSAGEVGVDLDAEHAVCDLVAFERMVQRFGRVNRRGNGEAKISVLLEREAPKPKEEKALEKALAKSERQRNSSEHQLVRQFHIAPKYRKALEALPLIDGTSERDASPEAFRRLKESAPDQVIAEATSPAPLRPELTRPILDAWSMTALEKHPGRPLVAPWLRGWVEDEPQSTVVWRKYLPTDSARCSDKQVKDFFEAAPIHLTEKLETSSNYVFKWLLRQAERIAKFKTKPPKKASAEDVNRLPKDEDTVALVLNRSGDLICKATLKELLFQGEDKAVKYQRDTLARQLQEATLVVDSRMGGISRGLLDNKASETASAETADVLTATKWIETSATDAMPVPPFRITIEVPEDQLPRHIWKECFRMPLLGSKDEEASRFLVVSKFKRAVTSEESRSTIGFRSLRDHLDDTEAEAAEIAERLSLPEDLTLALRIAARNHDYGKDYNRWQNAFSAPEVGRPFAKTSGPFRNAILDGYRHELGSLRYVEQDTDFTNIRPDLQDLALHLVAAHHGFARPVIRVDGCPDAPSVLQDRARDVALRFARLQERWGPWGLAWLESLLRAADQRASALVDDDSETKERAHG